MCDCTPWHHPIWALVAKRAGGVKVGVVLSILSVLREEDPVLARLSPPDVVAVLSRQLGWKPIEVALVLQSLKHSGVIDEALRLTEKWQNRAASERLKASERLNKVEQDVSDGGQDVSDGDQDAAESARQRALRSARNRRHYVKSRAGGRGPGTYTQTYAPSDHAAALEEDRDNGLFPSEENAGEPSRERHPTIVKREALATRVFARAQRSMRSADYGRFLAEINEGDRYERFLQRGSVAFPPRLREIFERLVTESKPRDGPVLRAPAPAGQRSLLLPMEGGRRGGGLRQPTTLADIADDRLREALAGLGEAMRETG